MDAQLLSDDISPLQHTVLLLSTDLLTSQESRREERDGEGGGSGRPSGAEREGREGKKSIA